MCLGSFTYDYWDVHVADGVYLSLLPKTEQALLARRDLMLNYVLFPELVLVPWCILSPYCALPPVLELLSKLTLTRPMSLTPCR